MDNSKFSPLTGCSFIQSEVSFNSKDSHKSNCLVGSDPPQNAAGSSHADNNHSALRNKLNPILLARGWLRLKDIIGDRKSKPPIPALLPVSRSHWYDGVRRGLYPKPSHQFGSRIAVWAVEDIVKLLEREIEP